MKMKKRALNRRVPEGEIQLGAGRSKNNRRGAYHRRAVVVRDEAQNTGTTAVNIWINVIGPTDYYLDYCR